jgi:hypothetical protein
MAMKNGMWNIITMKLCPGSMGVRHFIPLTFVLSIILLPILSIVFKPFLYLFKIEIILYFLLDIYFSLKLKKDWKSFGLLMILFPIFHVTYGIGSMKGIAKLLSKEFN